MRVQMPAALAGEADALARQYGAPLERHAVVGLEAYWRQQTTERDAEVCMVIRRPGGRLLTFTKAFYPADLYRLLTGSVVPGESIRSALLRETHEETSLSVTLQRFLAVVTYSPEDAPVVDMPTACYAAFAFLLDAPTGTPVLADAEEPISGFREVRADDLRAIADRLDALPDVYFVDLHCSWREWGRFRAVLHRAVADALGGVRPAVDAVSAGGPD